MKTKLKLFIISLVMITFSFCPPLSLNAAKSEGLIELVPCAFNSSKAETLVTRIEVGQQPLQLDINSITKKIYVTNFVDDTVSVIDSETNAVLKTISVGRAPNGISLNSKNNKIYVANQLDNTVTVIDGSTDTILSVILVGQKPVHIALNENTNKIYVSNQDSNSVSVIDGNTDIVTTEIVVGAKPQGIGINTKTNKIYVANTESDNISVIDGLSNTVTKTLENLITNPTGVTVDEEKNIIYAFAQKGDTLLGRGVLYVIDGSTDTAIQGIIIGSYGSDISFNKASGKVYITHTFDSTIDGYNTKKDELLCLITEIFDPAGIAIDPVSDLIYVCESFSSKVAVLQDTSIKAGDDKKPNEPEKPKEPENPNESENNNTNVNSELVNDFNVAIEELTNIQAEIKNSSRYARPVAARMNSPISKLKKSSELSESICESQLEIALGKLDDIVTFFESKSCSEIKTRRCIPVEIVDDLLATYEEQIEVIRSIIETDDNGNNTFDLCEE